jgi:hypothetical protein
MPRSLPPYPYGPGWKDAMGIIFVDKAYSNSDTQRPEAEFCERCYARKIREIRIDVTKVVREFHPFNQQSGRPRFTC